MRTIIIHYKDGSTQTLTGDSPETMLKLLKDVSWYEEPLAETKIKEHLEEVRKEEETGSKITERTIAVPSASDPSKTYDVVVLPNGSVWCPCTGFANRHNCWHSTYVKELLEEEKNNGARKV